MGVRRTFVVLSLSVLMGTSLTAPTEAAGPPRTVVPVAHARGHAPSTPDSGRFHALPSPTRVVSHRALAKGTATVLPLGGHRGLPASGIRALAVTLTATSARPMSLDAGVVEATVPSLVGPAGTTSAFAIVPVSPTGDLHVWNAGKATTLDVTVTGWFADTTESTTAGLFDRLAGRTLYTGRLGAGAHKTIDVAGSQDVPADGARAALVRVSTPTGRGTGSLGLAPTAKRARPRCP